MKPRIGDVFLHNAYYRETESGPWLPKYMVVLGHTRAGDVVYRLLTSQHKVGRPTAGCSHDVPYPSFALDTLGGLMSKPTWVDMREADDFDVDAFVSMRSGGTIVHHCVMPGPILCAVLDCVARADDTTVSQASSIRDARATLGCP